jgi:hypothetical protein
MVKMTMPRRPAQVTQADIARVIRAAKQAGAAEVEIKIGVEQSIIVRFTPSTDGDKVATQDVIEITPHGRPVWYVRIGKGPRIRIKAEYGTLEFETAYQAAISGESCQGQLIF